MTKVEEITAPYQVTYNGTVISYQIENEFTQQWSNVEDKIPKPIPIADATSNSFRAYLYINGYQHGRYYPYLNKAMNAFPAPPRVWNYYSDSIIGFAIWNQEEKKVKCDLQMKVENVLASSLDVKFDGTYLRPGRDEKRLLYA
ncbi:hypothetical protein BDW71DRAFT_202096 [Aspergillus fruticulosus]